MDESVIKHLEQPFALLPKLSEAIRIGSKMSPPAHGVFYSNHNKGTCVQGAALEAVGALTEQQTGRRANANHDMMAYLWPEFIDMRHELVSLFNNRIKTREEVADILESKGL